MEVKCDFHMHTRSSDGRNTAGEMIRKAMELGIRCLAITDHDKFDGALEGRRWLDEHGIKDVVVLIGAEVTGRPVGHVLVLCPDFKGAIAPMPLDQIKRWADANGCIAAPAHPFSPYGAYGMRDSIYQEKWVAVEVFNARDTLEINSRNYEAARQIGAAMLADSDAHSVEELANANTYTVLDVDELTPIGVLNAIRNKQIRRLVWRGTEFIL